MPLWKNKATTLLFWRLAKHEPGSKKVPLENIIKGSQIW